MSAARVADVLLAVGMSPEPLGVSVLARRLSLSKAVVYRILQSLQSRQLLRFDDQSRTYALGPAALVLGSRALDGQDLRTAALPILRHLQHVTGETTTVSALVGTSRIYLDQVVSPRELKMMVEIGRSYPLHAGSSSKAILAFVSQELRDQILEEGLDALTSRTITDAGSLVDELLRVARTGVAVSRGERQHGAASVAAPVFGCHGDVAGSISICGPIQRFDAATIRRYAPLVKRSAEEISRSLNAGMGDLPPAAEGASHG